MDARSVKRCTAFAGYRRVASGDVVEVSRALSGEVERGEREALLVFDDRTGEQVEIDTRGTPEDTLARPPGDGLEADGEPPRRGPGPGRPKMGVVAREVTLLPRHWAWLEGQPGGASAALRRLVEDARRTHAGRDRARESREAAYRFMSALGGNLPGFEEAIRGLFALDRNAFETHIAPWPADVRQHAQHLADASFAPDANLPPS